MKDSTPHHEDIEVRLTAYLLGELEEQDAKEIEAKLKDSAPLRAILQELKTSVSLLRKATHPPEKSLTAETDIPSRLCPDRREALLRALRHSDVIQETHQGSPVNRVPWFVPMGLAAMLIVSLSAYSLMIQMQQLAHDSRMFASADSGISEVSEASSAHLKESSPARIRSKGTSEWDWEGIPETALHADLRSDGEPVSHDLAHTAEPDMSATHPSALTGMAATTEDTPMPMLSRSPEAASGGSSSVQKYGIVPAPPASEEVEPPSKPLELSFQQAPERAKIIGNADKKDTLQALVDQEIPDQTQAFSSKSPAFGIEYQEGLSATVAPKKQLITHQEIGREGLLDTSRPSVDTGTTLETRSLNQDAAWYLNDNQIKESPDVSSEIRMYSQAPASISAPKESAVEKTPQQDVSTHSLREKRIDPVHPSVSGEPSPASMGLSIQDRGQISRFSRAYATDDPAADRKPRPVAGSGTEQGGLGGYGGEMDTAPRGDSTLMPGHPDKERNQGTSQSRRGEHELLNRREPEAGVRMRKMPQETHRGTTEFFEDHLGLNEKMIAQTPSIPNSEILEDESKIRLGRTLKRRPLSLRSSGQNTEQAEAAKWNGSLSPGDKAGLVKASEGHSTIETLAET
ncbi:hypothetical protein OAK97_03070, partial [bacterium]|nr:hypothetical protein [bacterium]